MKTKNFYFASANTGDGFYGDLGALRQEDEFMYIIKGGSGMGKSTLMKKVARYFWEKGECVELFYCSTDPKSLDAVRLKHKKVLIVDGTSPHIVEPYIFGVTHKIIDMGISLDEGIKKEKSRLENLISKKKSCYKMAYKYLTAAKTLDAINLEEHKNNANSQVIKKQAKNIYSKIKPYLKKGANRDLFLDCLNDKEISLERKNKFKSIVFLGDRYNGFLVLKELEKMLFKSGCEYTKILDVLNPSQINSIVINNKYLIKNNNFNLKNNKNIENNLNLIKKIKKQAKNNICKAKKIHLEIEEIYSKYINFNQISNLTNHVIKEIE